MDGWDGMESFYLASPCHLSAIYCSNQHGIQLASLSSDSISLPLSLSLSLLFYQDMQLVPRLDSHNRGSPEVYPLEWIDYVPVVHNPCITLMHSFILFGSLRYITRIWGSH